MCGIVGFITNEGKTLEDSRARFLRQSIIVDTLRGDDSTGVFGVPFEYDEKSGPYWCKEVSDGYQFVNGSTYGEHFWDVGAYRAAVGHNRAATVGGIDVATAHPFVVGPITLVHNGTLHSTANLPLPMRLIEDCNVDSHAIAHNLAEHTVAEVIAKLDGAFTLVWHDNRDDSMNIIRNNKRPLHMAMGKNQDTLFFASEGSMLDFVATRCNISIGSIYYPKEGQHLKWLPDTPLMNPVVEELDMYEDDWGKLGGYSSLGGYWDNALGVWVEDDDDDDWRNPATYSGSSQHAGKWTPPQDDLVFVGGRRKEVPMLLQEALMKHDLVVEDRLTFIPKVSLSLGEKRVQVYGMIKGKLKAVIYSALDSTSTFMRGTWTVRPIGVYVRPSGEPTIIVKLVNLHGPHGGKVAAAPSVGEYVGDVFASLDDEDLYDMSEDGQPQKWRGPFGQLYSMGEWHAMTKEGCGFCEETLTCEEHKEIKWINNGVMPLCGDCTMAAYGGADEYEEDV